MNKRTYNFSAGPAALPVEVLEEIQKELMSWRGCGYSVMESSHRNPEYIAMTEEAEQDFRDLMSIPENYHVLFCSGGASFQFAAAPLNLMGHNQKADYLHTGLWSRKAIDEAERFGQINVVASSEQGGFVDIPDSKEWNVSEDAAYFFYTPNETVHGLHLPFVPETGKVPLVADMTSSILQECVDVTRFGIIFAGVQKNIAPAGMTIVIVRDDLLDQSLNYCPGLLNYRSIQQKHSMPNTPPTFSWYVAGLTFKWLKARGGVKAMSQLSHSKAKKLYATIDASDFYFNSVKPAYRSVINIPFRLADEGLNAIFLSEAKKHDIRQIKGHRVLGGMRASLYNAISEEAVDVLVSFMNNFEQKYG